jgi:phosphate-selective porin
LLSSKWEYRLGIFNGTGIGVNEPTNSLSDDFGIPSLLYFARLAFMPLGVMPVHQGSPDDLNNHKILFAASASYFPEANYESSNDFRTGLEFAWLHKHIYISAEAYLLNTDFTDRQQISPDYRFWGAYAQGGYFVTTKLQPTVRFDIFDRNSTKEDGLLYMPSVGVNYYLFSYNLKLQAMYQMLKKSGHKDTFSADDDDNGMPEHMAQVMLQFSF